MTNLRIFADFHNADLKGRLRLNCRGTLDDLNRTQIALAEGLMLTFYSEDLEVEGEVTYSTEEKLWVAKIEWDAVRQYDDSEQIAGIEEQP